MLYYFALKWDRSVQSIKLDLQTQWDLRTTWVALGQSRLSMEYEEGLIYWLWNQPVVWYEQGSTKIYLQTNLNLNSFQTNKAWFRRFISQCHNCAAGVTFSHVTVLTGDSLHCPVWMEASLPVVADCLLYKFPKIAIRTSMDRVSELEMRRLANLLISQLQ